MAQTQLNRVAATPAAIALIRTLKATYGDLMFHQSGGCCDGSAPMCYPLGEFVVGDQDVLLGEVDGCPVYMGAQQFEYWRQSQLTLDVAPGPGGNDFSLAGPDGSRFITRSRLLTAP